MYCLRQNVFKQLGVNPEMYISGVQPTAGPRVIRIFKVLDLFGCYKIKSHTSYGNFQSTVMARVDPFLKDRAKEQTWPH